MKLFAYVDDPLTRVAANIPFHMVEDGSVRQIPGGRWDRRRRVWHWPITALPKLIELFPSTTQKHHDTAPHGQHGAAAAAWWQGHRLIPAALRRAREINEHKQLTAAVAHEVAARGIGHVQWQPGPDGTTLIPMGHQVRGCNNALTTLYWLLAHKTGTGKTITAGMFLSVVVREHDGMRIGFVVCPKTLIEAAWEVDLKRFFPDLPFLNLQRVRKGRRRAETLRLAQRHGRVVALCNYEMVRGDADVRRAMSGAAIVFDESSVMKNRRAGITKAVTDLAPCFRACVLLSGTPAPNTPMEYYPQAKIIAAAGGPDVFPGTLTAFRAEFCAPGGFGKYLFRHEKVGELHERMSRVAEWVTKEECLDLPAKVYVDVPIELSPATAKAYREMESTMIAHVLAKYGGRLNEEHRSEAVNALSQMMKLRQITAGFVPAVVGDWIDGGSRETQMVPIGDEKIQWVINHVTTTSPDERIIVWTQFRFETDRLMDALEKANGQQPKDGKWVASAAYVDGRIKKRQEIFEQFKAGKFQVLVLHPGVAQFGLSFPGVSQAPFMSCSHSLQQYLQAQDRIHGVGRGDKEKHSTFYTLTAVIDGAPTIDRDIQDVLDGKNELLEIVFRLDRDRRRETQQAQDESVATVIDPAGNSTTAPLERIDQ